MKALKATETTMSTERPTGHLRPFHGFVSAGEALAKALKANPHPDLKALGDELGGGK